MIFRTLVLSIFALTLSVANADISPLPATATVYEDAEQGTTDGWGVYDNTPAGASISNVFDADKESSVIEFLGGATSNGYRLGHNNANNVNAWGDTNSTIISWDSKFSESMVVYIPVETTDGFRYLYYTARNNDLGIHANPTYVHHGIGANQKNGAWHTTARDLEADLKEFEPNNSIISVNGILIRGSGRVDNIATLQEMPPTPPVPEQIIYEDAENGDTVGWDVYDKTPEGATFTNVLDTDKNSNVIEISGDERNNGFRLGHNNANSAYAWNDIDHKVISWDGKFDEQMVVYIPVQTTFGFRYLYYTARNNDLGIHANSTYIHHGIGANRRDGTWRTTYRDLEADLKEFEPDNQLLAVNGFLVRGNGRIDNIATSNEMPPVLPVPSEIIYEDAENGNTAGWDVYDKTPEGATFSNVDDADSGSKAIQLSGSATANGYRLGHNNSNHPNAWYNSDHKTISWDSKFSEAMVVYVPVQTTNGFRYLYYTAIDDNRGIHSNPTYIHHGIGEDQKNGAWHTNVRDLQADLHDFEPDNQIITVNGILIRGSGRVDNIKTSGEVFPLDPSYEIKFHGDIPATTVPRNLSISLFEQGLAIIASVVDDEGNTVADAVPTYDVSTVDLTTAGNYSLTFSYSYTNASGDTVTITKDLPVIVENHLPSAAGQSLTVEEDTSDNVITLTGHDSNVGDTLTYEITTQPANGTLGGTAPNVTYTPNGNFFGTDSFIFTLSDNTDTSAPATVNINVTDVAEPNTAPIAIAQDITINEGGGSIEITIRGTDADGDPLHYSVLSSPDGFLSGSTGGTFTSGVTLTYATPNSNYFGTTSFTFTVSDGTVTSAPATVVINVTSVNDVPTIGALDRVYLDEDSTGHAITLAVNDVEGDPLTYTIVGPNNGVLSGTAPSLTYTPNENYFGTDSFTITANDGTGDSLPRTIDITVNSINDAPTVNAGADTSVPVNIPADLTGIGSDVEGPVTYSWAESGSDEVLATTASFSYTPTTVGEHTLTLTVIDSDGATASDTVLVVATVPDPYSISLAAEGEDIPQGASLSDLEGFLFNIGGIVDGDGNDTGLLATEYSGTVDLNTVGTYYVRLEYTDPFDRLVQSSEIEIRVNAVAIADSLVVGYVRDTSGNLLDNVSIQVIDEAGETFISLGSDNERTANGFFFLPLPAETNFTLKFTRDDLATQVLPIRTPASEGALELDVTLIPRGIAQTVVNGTTPIVGANGAQVLLGSAAFENSQGEIIEPVGSNIQVTITPVDVSSPVGLAAFPGEFTGVTDNQVSTPIVSYGTVEYEFTLDGEVLTLVGEAEIEIPLYVATHQDGTSIVQGTEIALWSLNESTGIWKQEGTGLVVASAASPTGLALRAMVNHFTWWNADAVMNPAFAQIAVTAPEGGTALIKIRTTGNVNGWRSDSVNTVIAIGDSTSPLPIPSGTMVCFWAEISFTSGGSATTDESCETVQQDATKSISLEVISAPLQLKATPSATVSTYVNVAPLPVEIRSSTFVTGNITYTLEGNLPAGVLFNPSSAVISGVPTEAGDFNFTVKGVADGNESILPFSYTVIDGLAPPNLAGGSILSNGEFRPQEGFYSLFASSNLGVSSTSNLSLASIGGEVTSWEVTFDRASVVKDLDTTNIKLRDIDISQFGYSINSSGLLTINNWPINIIDTVDRRDIRINGTVTASNASGATSMPVTIFMENDGEYYQAPDGSSICDDLPEEEIPFLSDDLANTLMGLSYQLDGLLSSGASESNSEVQELRRDIKEVEGQSFQLGTCLNPYLDGLNGEVIIVGRVLSSIITGSVPQSNVQIYISTGNEGENEVVRWKGTTDNDGYFVAIYEAYGENYAEVYRGTASGSSNFLTGIGFIADDYAYELGDID